MYTKVLVEARGADLGVFIVELESTRKYPYRFCHAEEGERKDILKRIKNVKLVLRLKSIYKGSSFGMPHWICLCSTRAPPSAKRLDLNLDQTDTSSQPTKVIVAGHASSALAVSDGSEDLVVLGYGVESTRPESESR